MRRSYWYVYEWYGWKLCFRGIISNKDLLSISTVVTAFRQFLLHPVSQEYKLIWWSETDDFKPQKNTPWIIFSKSRPTVEIQYLKLFQKFKFSKWRFVGQLKYPRFRHTARVFIQFEIQTLSSKISWFSYL